MSAAANMQPISTIPRAVHFVHLKAALICPYRSVYIYHIPICKFFELIFPIRNFPLKGRLTGRDLEFQVPLKWSSTSNVVVELSAQSTRFAV